MLEYSDKTKKFLLFFLLLFGLTATLTIPSWLDTDVLAFFNYYCVAGDVFEIPLISGLFYSILPCNIFIWKIVQIFFGLLTLFVLSYSLERFYGAKKEVGFLCFFSTFFIILLLNFEDDNLALPIIIFSSYWLLSKPSITKKIFYAILSFLVGMFIWKGAFVIMGTIFVYSISPILSLMAIIGWFFWQGFSDWGNSSEAIMGRGFFFNNLLFWGTMILFILKRQLFEDKKIFWLATSFLLLSFIQPKWGAYLVIPLLILLSGFISKAKLSLKILEIFVVIGLAIFCFQSIFLHFMAHPTDEEWVLIQESVYVQREGFSLYNDWGLGRYIAFLGGKPSAAGYWGGEQLLPDKNFYWLGEKIRDCEIVMEAGVMVLQKC